MPKPIDLVQLIRDNPECHFTIDNDVWYMKRQHPDKNPHDYDDDLEAYEQWEEDNDLCTSEDNIARLGFGGYGSGNCYGGDVLQALAKIVGVHIESV